MKKNISVIILRHKAFFADKSIILSTIQAFVYLLISLIINFLASQYAYVNKGNSVTDLLLDNLPVINMENAFITGTFVFLFYTFCLMVVQPQRLPFVVKTIAFFVVTRSLFLTLTHLGPSPLNTLSEPGEIGRAFTSGADLFFSGHTGLPYLFALMYWHSKTTRIIFLVSSCVAGAAVLLGHIHYSIDVASAFFITYGIHVIARGAFKKDLERFDTAGPILPTIQSQ